MREAERWEFRVLGPLSAAVDGREVALGRPRLRVLLAALLLHAGRPVTLQELGGLLWDEDPPEHPRDALQTAVRRLRAALGSGGRLVRTHPDGYSLDVGADRLDLDRVTAGLDRAAAAGAAGDPAAERALLAAALAEWRGPALADVPSDRLQRDEQPRLAELQLHIRERLVELDLAAGRHAELIGELRSATAATTLREQGWRHLMIALYRSGRRAEALDAYRAVSDRLREELGMDPGPELRELHRRILAGDAGLDVRGPAEPAPHSPSPGGRQPAGAGRTGTGPGRPADDRGRPGPPVRVPRQLPAAAAAFTGRARELDLLDALLLPAPGTVDATPIAVLTGPPGVGKTALAVHWARRAADRFPDGQLFLDLRGFAPTRPVEPADALGRLLRGLGTRPEDVPLDLDEQAALYRSLVTGRTALVVLDNAGTSEQVRPLLPGEPGCRVLVTSRRELRGLEVSPGAGRVGLDVLTPDEAAALLGRLLGDERVRRRPDLVAELAGLCDRLPLALRIAAANLGGAPAGRFRGYLRRLRDGNPLDELSVAEDQPVAVRATFDVSYAALPDAARLAFRLLGLHPGGSFDAAATAALTGGSAADATAALDVLATASLVQRGADGRVTMHDLLRRYAAELCPPGDPATAAARRRLLDFALGSADAAAAQLTPGLYRLSRPPADPAVRPLRFDGPDDAGRWLDAERDNLLALAGAAAELGPRPYAWHLADSLRGHLHSGALLGDWRRVAGTGLRAAEQEGDPEAEGAMHHSLGMLEQSSGRYRDAARHYRVAIGCFQRAASPAGQASSRNNLGIVCQELGEVDEARQQYRTALELARRAGNLTSQGNQLGNLGAVARQLGRLAEARAYLARSLTAYRQAGVESAMAPTVSNLGTVLYELGDVDGALRQLHRALRMDRRFADRHDEAVTMASLAAVLGDAGPLPEARRTATAALALARETDNRKSECDALNALGGVSLRAGRPDDALAHHRGALELARRIEYREPEIAALLGSAAAHLAAGRPAVAADRAAAAVRLAELHRFGVYHGKALTALAAALLGNGEVAAARRAARRALGMHKATGHRPGAHATRQLLAEIETRAPRVPSG